MEQTKAIERSGDDYSHKEAIDIFKKNLDSLLASDPLLNDLPSAVTLEEVNSLIGLEHGQAMSVVVNRQDGSSFPVIVHQDATVADLKKAVERATALRLSRQRHRVKISWKHVWKTYWLSAHGRKLKLDNAPLKQWSIRNNDRVAFVKRLREKRI